MVLRPAPSAQPVQLKESCAPAHAIVRPVVAVLQVLPELEAEASFNGEQDDTATACDFHMLERELFHAAGRSFFRRRSRVGLGAATGACPLGTGPEGAILSACADTCVAVPASDPEFFAPAVGSSS